MNFNYIFQREDLLGDSVPSASLRSILLVVQKELESTKQQLEDLREANDCASVLLACNKPMGYCKICHRFDEKEAIAKVCSSFCCNTCEECKPLVEAKTTKQCLKCSSRICDTCFVEFNMMCDECAENEFRQ
jgi:hypothetical protein